MKRPLPVFVDESALAFDRIGISGGLLGTEIVLDPRDLMRAVGSRAADLTR